MTAQVTSGDMPEVGRLVRRTQVLKSCFIGSVASGGVYVGIIVSGPAPPRDLAIVWLMAGLAGLMVVAWAVVPKLVTQRALRHIAAVTVAPARPSAEPVADPDDGRLAEVLYIHLIIGSSLLTGAAFANLYAYHLTRHALSWVTCGILWVLLIFDFPTRFSVQRWMAEKWGWIRDERGAAESPHS